MFIENKYNNWYYRIIENAIQKKRKRYPKSHQAYVYYERHHILPKCLGGLDDNSNLVLLTPKEHFICHRLLTKMTEGVNKTKMVFACVMMIGHKFKSGRLYEQLRKELSNRAVSDETRKKMSLARKGKQTWMKGKTHTEEAKKKISKAGKGRIPSKSTLEKRSVAMRGVERTEQWKNRISDSVVKQHETMSLEAKKKRSEKISKKTSEWRWVTNGEDNLKIHISEMCNIPCGYKRGRTIKKKCN